MLEHFCVITFTLLHVTCTKFTISYLWGIEKKSFDREGTLKFHYKFFFVVCMYVNIFAKANTNNMNIAVGR